MSGLRHETEAALEGIARSLSTADVDAALLLIPLAKIGDALRMGIDIPRPVRHWSDALDRSVLGAACRAVTAELATWSLPDREVVDVGDPVLGHVLYRRDEVESFLLAINRIARKAGADPAAIEGRNALHTALVLIDKNLMGLLSQDQALWILGARAQLQGDQSWTSKLRSEAVEVPAPLDAQVSTIGVLGRPSEELVMKYLATGNLAGYVEAYSARDEEFTEGLLVTIDLMRATGEQLGLAARRWQKDRDKSARAAETGIQFEILPQRAAAATTVEETTETQHLDLGWLHPLGVTAAIEVTGTTVTVSVSAEEPQQLSMVVFGEGVVRAPDELGNWETSTRRTAAPIRLRVEMSDGRSFSEDLVLSSSKGP